MKDVVGGFPDAVSLGTLLEQTQTGWRRWFDACGPVNLTGRVVALDAADPALDHLAELPPELRGLSLAGLPVQDDDVAVIVERLPYLTWLDLRGTRVTARVHGTLRRLRQLRRLGLDSSAQVIRSGVFVRTDDVPLIPSHSGLPEPDAAGFTAMLTAAVIANPGRGSGDPEDAGARASLLLDAGRPEQALAVLAPLVASGDPGLLLIAARCANEIGTSAQALAALALAPPTVELLAWRAIFLSRTAPAQAVAVGHTVLREKPGDTASLWAICSAYLNAGQFPLATRALEELEESRPGWPDSAKLAARLARGQRRYRDEVSAWHRVLAVQPDDADALAGLARAQRSVHPLSMTWMSTLNAAATADVDRHGESLLEQVTRHRRQLSRLLGTVAAVVTFLVGSAVPWVATRRLGVAPALGLLVAYLIAALLWALTPAAVRRVIRRTDDLTGRRRAPNWRRPLLGALVAAVALTIPLDVPRTDGCDGKYQSACTEPIVAPVIQNPTRSIPPTPQQPSRSPKTTAEPGDPTAVADLRMLTHGQ